MRGVRWGAAAPLYSTHTCRWRALRQTGQRTVRTIFAYSQQDEEMLEGEDNDDALDAQVRLLAGTPACLRLPCFVETKARQAFLTADIETTRHNCAPVCWLHAIAGVLLH